MYLTATCLTAILKPSKSLSQNSGPSGRDKGTSQVNQAEKVLHLLFKTNEQLAEAIHPGMSSLHHPATCPVARNTSLLRLLFASSLDVKGVAPLGHQVTDIREIVTLVRTEMLWLFRRRRGPVLRENFQGVFYFLLVMSVGPADRHRQGGAPTVGEQMPLRATLGPVGGVGTRFFTSQGSLGDGAVQRLPCPINAHQSIVLLQNVSPQTFKDSGLRPFLKATMNCAS